MALAVLYCSAVFHGAVFSVRAPVGESKYLARTRFFAYKLSPREYKTSFLRDQFRVLLPLQKREWRTCRREAYNRIHDGKLAGRVSAREKNGVSRAAQRCVQSVNGIALRRVDGRACTRPARQRWAGQRDGDVCGARAASRDAAVTLVSATALVCTRSCGSPRRRNAADPRFSAALFSPVLH